MPVAVVLSVWIGVLVCVYPSSSRAIRNFTISCVFKKRLPSSASAADDVTPMIVHNGCMAPLRTVGFPISCCFRGNNAHWKYCVPWFHSCITRLGGLAGSFWMQNILFWHQYVWHNNRKSVLHTG